MHKDKNNLEKDKSNNIFGASLCIAELYCLRIGGQQDLFW